MRQQLLHTPEGVRDIYSVECAKKIKLEEKLYKMFHIFGYIDIQTRVFVFFDVFREEIGTTPSKELYKFFDREGSTLVLRPDITPSIARAAATLFSSEDMPIRLCYAGNTFINHSSYQGRLKENTQLGAELIGDDSVEADAEMLALVVDSLKKAGLSEFQINVGNVEFFNNMIKEAELSEEKEERLRELINNHNFFGVDELLNEENVKKSSKEAFATLPELVGGMEIFPRAKQIAPNSQALKAIKRLEMIHNALRSYGVSEYITFDLSMSGVYGYYTGIVFRAYTFGTGDAVVKGGRYDHLVEKFGKKSPSIGFAIVVDELMKAIVRQKIEMPYDNKNTLIVYEEGKQKEAIVLAKDLRNKGKNTEIIKKSNEKPVEDYVRYGKRNLSSSMIYIQYSGGITMVNLITGDRKTLRAEE